MSSEPQQQEIPIVSTGLVLQLRDAREQIKVLQQLVKDYDNYLHEVMPPIYNAFKKPKQLRQRAREEGVAIQEPLV